MEKRTYGVHSKSIKADHTFFVVALPVDICKKRRLGMNFSDWKKKNAKLKADTRNPWMGLNGVACENPAYWCRLHEVWLSEADVEEKKCLSRITFDMIGTRKCNCLERKSENPFIKASKL